MPLPSYIPRCDTVELIDLDNLEYMVARRPANATLRAWSKLEETERRWTMFDWGCFVLLRPNRCTRLLADFASAYLLSFEATLQILKDEKFPTGSFEIWLNSQPAYGMECRGLRTLRQLEAHIRAGAISPSRVTAYSRFAGTSSGGSAAWYWPPITQAELASLRDPKLAPQDLSDWNKLSEEILVLGLMREGVVALTKLLNSAGP